LVVKNGSKRWRCTSSVHPDAGVAHRQQHVRARRPLAAQRHEVPVELDVGRLDRQPPAVGHRVARVGRQVHDHPLELCLVGLDRRQVGREPDADADIVDLRELLAAGHFALREQDLGVARDHHQQVVEVVRDPSGEPPDRLHPLGLPEPLLEPQPHRHVVCEHERGPRTAPCRP
jgi:hypothetical protein